MGPMPCATRNRAGREALARQIHKTELAMSGNGSNGYFGVLIGGLVAAAAVAFLLTGGEFGGKKTVYGDDDLPPVATTTSQ
jgi:hypothetical protein